MKKLALITVIMLLSGFAFGQNIQKGTLIGTHAMTVTLQPGVTMEKFMDFYKANVIPEMEKNYSNMKAYQVKGIRGEKMNSFGVILIFKSAQDRDKYYNADGGYSELGESAYAKLKPVSDELEKLGTVTSEYTDWIVQ